MSTDISAFTEKAAKLVDEQFQQQFIQAMTNPLPVPDPRPQAVLCSCVSAEFADCLTSAKIFGCQKCKGTELVPIPFNEVLA